MLLCCDDERVWADAGDAAWRAAMNEAIERAHELAAKGQYVMASPLHPASRATCMKVRDGKQIVTDGPYAETREVVGGFYIIDVDNLDDAIAIAARHSGVQVGTVEVRPMMEIPGLPNIEHQIHAGQRLC